MFHQSGQNEQAFNALVPFSFTLRPTEHAEPYFAAAFPFSDPKIGRLEASFSAAIACSERGMVWKVSIGSKCARSGSKHGHAPMFALGFQFSSTDSWRQGLD
jgi:hypothetical protein